MPVVPTQQQAPDAAWKSGGWNDTWTDAVPKDHMERMPKDYETIPSPDPNSNLIFGRPPKASGVPISGTFLMMAAAQMHSEGRLVQPNQSQDT